mgnify:CR=1 FL=1
MTEARLTDVATLRSRARQKSEATATQSGHNKHGITPYANKLMSLMRAGRGLDADGPAFVAADAVQHPAAHCVAEVPMSS